MLVSQIREICPSSELQAHDNAASKFEELHGASHIFSGPEGQRGREASQTGKFAQLVLLLVLRH
jgi:hypothetical protein